MNTNASENLFSEKIKHLLDRSAENLDSRTRQRLELIRLKALRGREETHRGHPFSLRWITVGGFAAATMAALALFFWLNTSAGDLPFKHVEDLEIITSKEHIDLYQDLDFYEWLAARENGGAKGHAL